MDTYDEEVHSIAPYIHIEEPGKELEVDEVEDIGGVEDVKEEEGMQVELGSVKSEKVDYHLYVAAEYWPSWAFVLGGMRFLSILVRVSHQTLSSMLEVKQTEVGQWLTNMDIVDWLDQHLHNNTLLLLQGSYDYYISISRRFADKHPTRIIFVCTDRGSTIEGAFIIKHEDCSGITDGLWSVLLQNFDLVTSC